MVVCSRCGHQIDETQLQECPLCKTPVPPANAAQQSSGIPGVPPAGGVMPQGQPSAPLLAPGARVSLTGEVYEANPQQSAPPSYVGGGGMPPRTGAPPPRPGGPSAARRDVAAPARSGSGGAILAVVLVLLLGGGGFGGYWYMMHRTNPKDQAEKFAVAAKAQDYKTMYELSDLEITKSASDYEEKFKQNFVAIPGSEEAAKNAAFKTGEATINGDTATVPLTISGTISLPILGNKDFSIPVALTLKNNMGIWKVTNDPAAFFGNLGGGGGGGRRKP